MIAEVLEARAAMQAEEQAKRDLKDAKARAQSARQAAIAAVVQADVFHRGGNEYEQRVGSMEHAVMAALRDGTYRFAESLCVLALHGIGGNLHYPKFEALLKTARAGQKPGGVRRAA